MDWKSTLTAMQRLGLAMGVLVLGTIGTSTASAQWATTVLEFEGPGGRRARGAVIEVIDEWVDLQDLSRLEAAAAETGADLGTDEGIAQAARAAQVSMVVGGQVTGRGRRARVQVRFIDTTGSELTSAVDANLPRNRRSRGRFNQQVGTAVGEALAALDRNAQAERAAEQEREAAEFNALAEGSEGEEYEPYDGGGGGDDSAETKFPTVRALVGLDGRARNMNVNLENGFRRTYEAFFPQFSFALEARPLAFLGGPYTGIFLSLDGSIDLGLSTEVERVGGSIVPVDTTAFRINVVAGYLYALEFLEVGASVGYAHDAFTLGANDTIPSATYGSLRFAVLLRVPLMEELLGAFLDFGPRIVLSTGDLTPTYGTSASAFGVDLAVGLMGALDFGLTYAARFGYVGYSLDFEGPGTLPQDTAVDGSDGGVFFGVQIGYQI